MREMMSGPRLLETESDGLTVRDLYKPILCVWLVILVGVIFTTETLVSLFYVLFRCRSVHCSNKPRLGIQP
jgi:hypothetical protein